VFYFLAIKKRLSSSDFTNGNGDGYNRTRRLSDAKQRLAEAIQRKLEDNRRNIRLPLKHRTNTLSRDFSRVSMHSYDEKSPISEFSESASNWSERSPLSDVVSPFLSPEGNSSGFPWDEKSPESEGSLGFPFSSGSESPSDPFSVLTVQNPPRE